jgi:hypothetical protein
MNYPLKDFAEFAEWGGGVIPEQRVQCGLLIRCPNCGVLGGVFFKNVIGGDAALTERFQKAFAGKSMWDRIGETLDTMTLNPSVKMNGHFHSWVKNGQLCVDSTFECNKGAADA